MQQHDDNETSSNNKPKKNMVITEIRLASYALKGTLPKDLYYLSSLEHLDLKGNFLIGTIPSKWCTTLTNLKSLCLAVNHLSGTLPSNLVRCTNLQHVWLSNNKFTGTLPQELFTNNNNDNSDAENTSSSSSYSKKSWWSNLTLFDVSSNRLTGTLPKFGSGSSTTSSISSLTNLFLENNYFTGTLPGDDKTLINTFRNLQVIDFGTNRFIGTIPKYWMLLPKLRDFNVAGNTLSGRIPTELLHCTTLEVFVLVRITLLFALYCYYY